MGEVGGGVEWSGELTVSVDANRFDPLKACDVLVVGGGNAGLCAAIAARQAGASVLLVEQASRDGRGGNSRHVRNLRIAHGVSNEFLFGVYGEDEYWADLVQVTGVHTDETLARLMIAESAGAVDWMAQCGGRFQKTSEGAVSPSRKTAFLLGGGKALLNAYYLTAERIGVDVLYDAEVLSLPVDGGLATIVVGGIAASVRAKAVVVASGSCQANIEWLRAGWGAAADGFVIRGSAYAKGRMLMNLLDQQVAPIGDPVKCHMVAVDARAPKFDGGIVTRLDCVPFGIVVDRNGARFHDEGADIGPRRYALWGRLVAQCPDQIAYAIFDAKAEGLFRPSIYPPIQAQSIGGLGESLAIDPPSLAATVQAFNRAVRPGDGRTEGIMPPKTRGAVPIDTPPYGAYPLRPGITFSYLGVKIDENARVLMANGRPSGNLFAAGSIMAGNVLGHGYLAGIGLTIGTVFGRIAGREAARYAGH